MLLDSFNKVKGNPTTPGWYLLRLNTSSDWVFRELREDGCYYTTEGLITHSRSWPPTYFEHMEWTNATNDGSHN